MEKYRKAYYHIEKALCTGSYHIIILLGLRKTGKTTILQQLAKKHMGHYVDLRNSIAPEQDYLDIYDRDEKLILLDEIGYLPSFDAYFGNLLADICSVGKKLVITSSSYGTLKQLSSERLGGGRSHTVELFPLDFEEYLYFSSSISSYGEEYDPTEEDVQNFYRLKDVPNNMDFVIDRYFMEDTFTDVEVARANQQFAQRNLYLTREQYIGALDVIAYTLNSHLSLKRFGSTPLGRQEFSKHKGISMSKTLIGLANQTVGKITGSPDISGLADIIKYLYHSGFLFVDLAVNENSRQISDRVIYDLGLVKTRLDFEQVLNQYEFSVISPLLYTRLMLDLEDVVGRIYDNPALTGQLFELTVKSEAIYAEGYTIYHDSHKYKNPPIEVDLLFKNLLLEATIRKKSKAEHSVDKVLIDHQLIRVLTTETGTFEDTGVFYRIGYSKALLMLSNRSIFNLEARKVEPSSTTEEPLDINPI